MPISHVMGYDDLFMLFPKWATRSVMLLSRGYAVRVMQCSRIIKMFHLLSHNMLRWRIYSFPFVSAYVMRIDVCSSLNHMTTCRCADRRDSRIG